MNTLKTLILLSILSALLIGLGYFVVGGTLGILIGIGMAAVSNLGAWFFSDQIALNAYGAQPIGADEAPDLQQMLVELSQTAGIPTPQLYRVDSPAANAFATGRDPNHAAVAVTDGIVNLLDREQLRGVLAHELTHVLNRDTLTQAVAATIAGAISSLAYMAQWASYGATYDERERSGGNPLGLLFAVFLAPLAATVIQMGISRTREFSADAGAAKLTGNPRALASALERLELSAQQASLQANPSFSPLLIVNSLSGRGFLNLFSTHPSTQERIERLMAMAESAIA
jgi:heat shock protein HtpX